MLEIKNLRTGETIVMNAAGTTFGRAGAGAEVSLRDQAISKQHAKIYQENGVWYLEDLGSSNGTFVNKQKISERVPLTAGLVFALSRFKFEVQGAKDEQPLFDENKAEDISPPASSGEPVIAPAASAKSTAPPRPPRPIGVMGAKQTAAPAQAGVDGEDGPKFLVKAIPQSIKYYLAAVPLFAVNPLGSVRKSIEDQVHEPMGPWQLIGFAMPAFVFSSVVGAFAGAIATAMRAESFGSAIGGAIGSAVAGIVVGLIAGAIGSAVIGFLGHPVLRFVVEKLKGDSDERARTNYFMSLFTAIILVAAVQAVGTVLGGFSGKLTILGALGPLIVGVAGSFSVLIVWRWFEYFRVHHIAQKVLMALAVVPVVLGVIGTVKQVIDGGAALFSSSSSSDGKSDDTGDEETDADKDEDEEKDADTDDEETKAAALAAQKAELKKQLDDGKLDKKQYKAALAALEKSSGGGKPDGSKPDGSKPDGSKPDGSKPDGSKPDGSKPDGSKPDGSKPDGSKPDGSKPDGSKPDKPAPPDDVASAPTLSYPEFVTRLKKIESAFQKDPTLVERPDLNALYAVVSKAEYEAKKEFDAEMKKSPENERVHEAARQSRFYKDAANAVAQLSGKL